MGVLSPTHKHFFTPPPPAQPAAAQSFWWSNNDRWPFSKKYNREIRAPQQTWATLLQKSIKGKLELFVLQQSALNYKWEKF